MSDKPFAKLNAIDAQIRRCFPDGFGPGDDGIHVTIEFFSGFEKFNTRPYHNYEAWSDGYRITGKGVTVESEDLDDAVTAFCDKLKESPDAT